MNLPNENKNTITTSNLPFASQPMMTKILYTKLQYKWATNRRFRVKFVVLSIQTRCQTMYNYYLLKMISKVNWAKKFRIYDMKLSFNVTLHVYNIMILAYQHENRLRQSDYLLFNQNREIDFFTRASFYGGVEGPPHIFFDIMLSHTDDIITRP